VESPQKSLKAGNCQPAGAVGGQKSAAKFEYPLIFCAIIGAQVAPIALAVAPKR